MKLANSLKGRGDEFLLPSNLLGAPTLCAETLMGNRYVRGHVKQKKETKKLPLVGQQSCHG
eukprot:1138763-Pelagomonas_calceolata.AAC.11